MVIVLTHKNFFHIYYFYSLQDSQAASKQSHRAQKRISHDSRPEDWNSCSSLLLRCAQAVLDLQTSVPRPMTGPIRSVRHDATTRDVYTCERMRGLGVLACLMFGRVKAFVLSYPLIHYDLIRFRFSLHFGEMRMWQDSKTDSGEEVLT